MHFLGAKVSHEEKNRNGEIKPVSGGGRLHGRTARRSLAVLSVPIELLDALDLRRNLLAGDMSVLRSDLDVTIDAVITFGNLTNNPFRGRN